MGYIINNGVAYGGGMMGRELTLAEYNALPEEEKTYCGKKPSFSLKVFSISLILFS